MLIGRSVFNATISVATTILWPGTTNPSQTFARTKSVGQCVLCRGNATGLMYGKFIYDMTPVTPSASVFDFVLLTANNDLGEIVVAIPPTSIGLAVMPSVSQRISIDIGSVG